MTCGGLVVALCSTYKLNTGWWLQPLWKILVSWDDYYWLIPNIYGKIKKIPNHQSATESPTSKPSTGSRASSLGCRPPFSDRSQLFRLDLARNKDRGTVADKMGEILTLNSLNHPFQVVTYNFWPISTRFVEFLDSMDLLSWSSRMGSWFHASPPPPPGFKWQHMRARGLCQPGC